jgi:predicted house-cleaning NTP pyrophosphatase (Maf/HAM1 superfamily)
MSARLVLASASPRRRELLAQLGVSFDEAVVLQRERSSARPLEYEEPNVIFFQDPKVIAAKVASQMDITPEEAAERLRGL